MGRVDWCTLLALVLMNTVSTERTYRTDFLEALMIDYDNRIPPNFEKNNSTEVEVSLFINSIDSISEKTMDYTMSAFVQQEWTDDRLRFLGLIEANYLELDSKLMKEVWVPDLYFTNEKRATFHDITVPNRMLHLYSDGRIIYRLRVSVTAACPMSLHKYPFDSQVCSLVIQSFAFTQSRLRFKWKKDNPIRTNTQLELPQFQLMKHEVMDCEGYGGQMTANFTCIKLDLHLTRSLGFYMIQIYIPTVLIVMLSWVSFWLSIDAVPARISLGILTVLTMTTQKTNAVAAVPPVSYVKAMDIWMAACLLFVFAALLEFAFVYVMNRNETKRVSPTDKNEGQQPLTKNKSTIGGLKKRFIIQQAKKIDNIAKIIFPVVYVVFIVIYWISYKAV